MEVKGKAALVTGGASGIGLACVRELLREGAKVAICDVDAGKGEATVKSLSSDYGPDRVMFIKADVTKAEEFEDAFKTAIARFKRLDIVLNNAGVCDVHNWEKTIAVNFSAVVRGTELALRYMGMQTGGEGGVLCNTASVAGLVPSSSMAVYSATKHAVVGLSRSYGLPYHLNRTGVRVVAMCPGLTDSTMATDILNMDILDDATDHLNKQIGSLTTQKADNVAAGMMVLLKTAKSGSVWVCRGGAPPYEVVIPDLEQMRKR